MDRVYTAPINIGAHTVQIDVFELLAGANVPLEVLGFELGQTSEIGDAQEEFISLVLKRVTGAPTSGSGGPAAPLFRQVAPNAAAAAAIIEIGNTTKLTLGTSVELARFVWGVRSGLLYVPVPEERIILDQGTRLVLEEVQTPIDSITGPVGRIVIRELI